MKPPPFEYDAPESLEEALDLLAEHGDDAKVLAGGQSLLPLMAMRLARPARLVDVGRIGALRRIGNGGALVIGAGVTQRTAERSADVARHCPRSRWRCPTSPTCRSGCGEPSAAA